MLSHIRILNSLLPKSIPSLVLPQRILSTQSTFSYRMSSSTSSQQPPATTNNGNSNDRNEEDSSSTGPMLTLPAPGDVPAAGGSPQLEVNGQDIKLDILGPVVVNEDGTMSRIDNWHEMAEIEKANVRRILLKRNAARLARLRAERDQDIAAKEAATTTPSDKQ